MQRVDVQCVQHHQILKETKSFPALISLFVREMTTALQMLYEATKMAASDVYQAFWTNCSKNLFKNTLYSRIFALEMATIINILRMRSSLLTFSYRSTCITCFVALAGCRPTQLCPDAFGHLLVAAMPPGNQLRIEGRADLFSVRIGFAMAGMAKRILWNFSAKYFLRLNVKA